MYLPKFQKQLDGTPFASFNCNCASAAMACDYHTLGKKVPTPAQIRYWTGDRSGGTRLEQVVSASHRYGVYLDSRYRYPWAEFEHRIDSGQGAILIGWYLPIRRSKFAGSETFYRNHAIFVPPGWGAMDPLADGRRPGIYKYHGEVYPKSLLRDYAGRLNIADTRRYPNAYRALGLGYVNAAFTKDNVSNAPEGQVDSDVVITVVKGEDWTPKDTRRPYRNSPIRGQNPAGYVELGQVVRTISEAHTPDGNNWRLTEINGKPAWLIREDFNPVVQGGDPATDAKLTAYIKRLV